MSEQGCWVKFRGQDNIIYHQVHRPLPPPAPLFQGLGQHHRLSRPGGGPESEAPLSPVQWEDVLEKRARLAEETLAGRGDGPSWEPAETRQHLDRLRSSQEEPQREFRRGGAAVITLSMSAVRRERGG